MDDECRFAVRIVDLDWEMVRPEEMDNTFAKSRISGRALGRVPVIRLFGATPRGQTACVHVHGVFRYFLVPFDDRSNDRSRLRQLADALNRKLATNRQIDPERALERVYDLRVVRLTPFYGYHEEPRAFLRVEMADPNLVPEAAAAFAEGLGGWPRTQPYEAHVPYLLQFKADYNLLGMGFARFGGVLLRGDLPARSEAVDAVPAASSAGSAGSGGSGSGGGGSGSSAGSQALLRHRGFSCVWTRGHTHGLVGSGVAKVSSCELEADAMPRQLLNQRSLRHDPLRDARDDAAAAAAAALATTTRGRCTRSRNCGATSASDAARAAPPSRSARRRCCRARRRRAARASGRAAR